MKVQDLEFKKFITAPAISEKVKTLANQLNHDYKDKTPIFLPILNGSFMFASDLLKEVKVPCRVSFVKTSSYTGTSSTGQLKTLIGHDESLFNQHIIIIEDIVDTGLTLEKIIEELRGLGAKSVEAVTLLRKKTAREKKVDVKYVGFELDNEFVLGYGMDYDGLGRNIKDLYKQAQKSTDLPSKN
ncbi:MAG: hypoxanthine phosphoribosyltransferase [Cyclobacteriaceae bacterium]|nr:hypoxanthine phosphoribosyltransferase [Cyclobacteriaceae bacterium]